MIIVVGIAAVALVALVVAVVTSSTAAAIAVVVLALAGILLLVRDWRRERRRHPEAEASAAVEQPAVAPPLTPDMFAPDISTDPDGPSSDARAD